MFKTGNNLSEKDINEIKENTFLSFGHSTVFLNESDDNVLIYKDNRIVSCAVIDSNNKFIFNLCTHPNYRKQGYANKLMNVILNKYLYINKNMALTLNVETNEKGIVPKKMYENQNWICENKNILTSRYTFFYLPQTGICDSPTRLIQTEILKYGNFLKDLKSKPISIIHGLIKFILGINDNINFNEIQELPLDKTKNNYQNLYRYKQNNNCSVLFNHVIYLEDSPSCYKRLENIKKKYKSCLYFLIVFILNKNFLLINKNENSIEYIVNKRKLPLILLQKYLCTSS